MPPTDTSGETDLANTAPHFLIVTPSYNQGQYLEETLKSVLRQDYAERTYVVADGESTDDSHRILKRHEGDIDRIYWGPDAGQSDAIATAVDDFARRHPGDLHNVWFNWINSDDRLTPSTLSRLAQTIRQNQNSRPPDALALNVLAFGQQQYVMPNRLLSAAAMIRDDSYRFAQPGLWMRLDQYQSCGGIDRRFQYGFDWDLWVRYLAQFPNVKYIEATGAEFRLHEASKTIVETSGEPAKNRFEAEHDLIRDKLSSRLPPPLADAAIWGGRRRRWHQELADLMDDPHASPLKTAGQIMHRMLQDRQACGSRRSVLSIGRLLSRYVRPGMRQRMMTDAARAPNQRRNGGV